MNTNQESNNTTYLNSTYEIVSKTAFLIGVREEIFDNENESPQKEWFHKMNEDKEARIIRNLCILRTKLFRNYKHINAQIYYNMKNLDMLPEYVPQDVLQALSEDGVSVLHVNWKLNQYIVFLNDEVKKHISNCKNWFPLWLNWEYIRSLFVMPKGNEDKQIKNMWGYYTNHINFYPYQMFMQLRAQDVGNILYNDEKFVNILYGIHGMVFEDRNKVNDASDYTKASIHSFIEQGDKIAVVVDCENANPYKLYSMLNNLPESYKNKIKKIILYNDIHTSSAWKLLNRFVNITIQHEMIDRVKDNKSLVDIRLTAGTCREYYQNHVDSFILVSSDSDYWGLITAIEECRFLVMVEYKKCSSAIVNAMKEKDIAYCYLDQFCSGDLESLQAEALLIEIRNYLKSYHILVDDLLKNAIRNTRVELSPQEIEQFKTRYLKKMRLSIEDGTILIDI